MKGRGLGGKKEEGTALLLKEMDKGRVPNRGRGHPSRRLRARCAGNGNPLGLFSFKTPAKLPKGFSPTEAPEREKVNPR